MTATTRCHWRWMIRRDYPDVLAMDAASHGVPLGEKALSAIFRHRNAIGYVVEDCRRVSEPNPSGPAVGFALTTLHTDHLRLLRLAVHPAERGNGFGTLMMRKVLGKLSSHRRTALLVSVSETNTAGLVWLRGFGFRAEGVSNGVVEMAFRVESVGDR